MDNFQIAWSEEEHAWIALYELHVTVSECFIYNQIRSFFLNLNNFQNSVSTNSRR